MPILLSFWEISWDQSKKHILLCIKETLLICHLMVAHNKWEQRLTPINKVYADNQKKKKTQQKTDGI